jgi:hypothetical protein
VPQTPRQNATPDFAPRDFEPWAEALDALRPWGDRIAVRELLEGWIGPGHPDAAEAVAEGLQNVGTRNPQVAAAFVTRAAFYLLRRVLKVRETKNRSPLDIMREWSLIDLAEESAIRPTTRRRYQRNADRWFELRQYDIDVALLVGQGKSVAAARQAVRRRRKMQSVAPSDRHPSRVEAVIALASSTDSDALHDGQNERPAPVEGLRRPGLPERPSEA